MNEKNPVQWVRSILFVGLIYLAMPIVGLLYAPWAMVSRKGAYAACKGYSRLVFFLARYMVGIRVEVRGTPPEGEALVASKHQSFLDIMMIFTAVPAGKFIMKKQILWTPVIGQYAKRLNCISVDRGKRGAAIEKMVREVKAGLIDPGQLIIYSQGTRVPPGKKVAYKVGTGVLYEQMGQSCYPVATNVGVLWPRTGIYRAPGVAVVEFLEPIEAGLPRDVFMALLEERVEARSDALMREAGFEPDGYVQA
jgi:1-acyl-sn-glycerol-3-phosphate acyltransferase